VKASFGEMLLLMAIHFHSNQLSAVCDLVCSTLGMKIPIRPHNLSKIKAIFVQDIFTEQVMNSIYIFSTRFSYILSHIGCNCSCCESAGNSKSLWANHRIFASALYPSAFEKQSFLKTQSANQGLDLQANLLQRFSTPPSASSPCGGVRQLHFGSSHKS
jgi:Integrator complex subunit 2